MFVTQAVILVGGNGTQVGEAAKSIPKPLAPISGDKRFLDYLVENLARQGFKDILVLAGHHADKIEAHFAETRPAFGALVRVFREASPLGAGGMLRNARDLLETAFLLVNGETYLDVNLRAFEREAAALECAAVLSSLRSDDIGRDHTLVTEGHLVRAFRETHEIEASPVLISAGVYRISREIIEDLPEAPSFLEFDLFPKLCMSGGLGHITVAGWFLDVGLPHALEQAQVDIPKRSLRPCVFFDRDNTLIHDKGYVHRPEDLVWIDGARDVIRGLNDAGWLVIVCTNQAGVAHGYYDEAAVDRFHLELTTSLAEIGAFIDAYFYCPFHEDAKLPNYRRDHEDRKPRPGMILRAIETCSVDASRSLMIGDRRSDAEAGVAAGIAGHIYAGGRLDAFVAGLPELSGVITYRREGQGQEVPGSQARENNQAD